jgi:hypothetical protein
MYWISTWRAPILFGGVRGGCVVGVVAVDAVVAGSVVAVAAGEGGPPVDTGGFAFDANASCAVTIVACATSIGSAARVCVSDTIRPDVEIGGGLPVGSF